MREVSMQDYLSGRTLEEHDGKTPTMVKVKSGVLGVDGQSMGIGVTLEESKGLKPSGPGENFIGHPKVAEAAARIKAGIADGARDVYFSMSPDEQGEFDRQLTETQHPPRPYKCR